MSKFKTMARPKKQAPIVEQEKPTVKEVQVEQPITDKRADVMKDLKLAIRNAIDVADETASKNKDFGFRIIPAKKELERLLRRL